MLDEAMPSAKILLYQFHVTEWLRQQIAGDEFLLAAWMEDRLRGLIELLVYAKSERESNKHREYMRQLLRMQQCCVSAQ